jgi:predicted nucleotide-binding protein
MIEDKRPSIFVASTSEGLPLVEAIQVLLDTCCEVIPWTIIFDPSRFTLESLVERMREFDFAIVVLTADDIVHSRGQRQPGPRDNLLVEIGLCIGQLGRGRVFLIVDRTNEIKLPTDLAGITLATYHPPRAGTLESALGPACATIKKIIHDLGPREARISC